MKNGFTLIQLIIVIGVMIGFAFILVQIVNPFLELQKARDKTRKEDLAKIAQGLEQHYQQFGSYPLNPSLKDYRIKGFKTDHQIIDWGEDFSPFITSVPKDPSFPSRTYVYFSTNDGQAYYLYASLERGGKDTNACKSDGSKCDNAPTLDGKDACGGVCNYGISSRNVAP